MMLASGHSARFVGTREPHLVEKAWALPVAATYRTRFEHQRRASLCGPASVVAVMRSLGMPGDPRAVLDGTGLSPFFGFLLRGTTLDQLARIARMRTGRPVEVLRDLDRVTFREHMTKTNDAARRYIVNFARGPLFGALGAHHSPIGGYLADEDLVFVLDVNRAYGPWLVTPDRLYEAVDTFDRSSGEKRGLLVIEDSRQG
jgi:hypothetical protein